MRFHSINGRDSGLLVQVTVSETSDFVSAFALGALGQIVMPFVEEPTPYIPAEGVKNDTGKVAPPSRASLSSCLHGVRH